MIGPEIAELLWNNCVIGLCEVDLSGSFVKVNPTFCSMLEYSESELQKSNIQKITHPDDISDDLEMIHRVVTGKLNYYTMTKRFITKNNHVILTKLRVDAVKHSDDEKRVIALISQVSPASYVVPDPLVEFKKTPKEFIKDHPHWAIGFIVGIGAILFSMLGHPEYRQFGELLVLFSLGGYNLQRDLTIPKK